MGIKVSDETQTACKVLDFELKKNGWVLAL